ncbi:MAG TPA: hypothetical protein DDW65_14320 [Firmicutes bacterium]|nr:hypothetical protein [Bacillota bacterium]
MTQRKKLKAEAFDVMQYFYSMFHDPLIHCLIDFDGHVDEVALKKAVSFSFRFIPMLQCTFEVTGRRPFWKIQGFTGDDVVHVVKAGLNTAGQKENLFAETIDMAYEPQLKINVIRGQNSDSLCIIMNHMVCDGAGFKEYLYLLSDMYTRYVNNMTIPISELQAFPRNARQLWAAFGWSDKLKILFARHDLSAQKNQLRLPLQGDVNHSFFATSSIAKEDFDTIRRHARQSGVTFNDLILTAYARVLFKEIGVNPIVIPCPVDLRRYLPTDWKYGITNLTGNLICNVTVGESESFEQTLTKVSQQLKRQKSSINCLKSAMMMESAYHILPFRTLQRIFPKVFTIPVVSFSNLGVIDKDRLCFGSEIIDDAYLTGAVKYVPYFQIAISTYNDSSTLSCNLHGTRQDRMAIEKFLDEVKEELLACSGSDFYNNQEQY